MNAPLNFTYIALIPKVRALVFASDSRPISLYNVLYKLFSKFQQTSLRRCNAFILDRLIIETLHTTKTRFRGRNGSMAMNFYMSKGYDRVEWPYPDVVMRKLGFGERWIYLTMECVIISHSILVNGKPRNSRKGHTNTRGDRPPIKQCEWKEKDEKPLYWCGQSSIWVSNIMQKTYLTHA